VPTSFRIALGLLLLVCPRLVQAQAPRTDLALTFLSERSLKAETTQNFWLEGGGAELGIALTHGVAIAASFSAAHTDSIGSSGAPLTLSVTAFGPRYRWHSGRRASVYGESLFGVARGTNSVFPTSAGTVSDATSFALQLGGGVDYRLSSRFAVRLLDVGYLRTTLPNGTDNEQNTLRLGAGIDLRF
jgi:opacity protein-like surface antigen